MCLHALQIEARTSSCGNTWEFIPSTWQNPGCQPILHPRHHRHSLINPPTPPPKHLTHLSSLFPPLSSRLNSHHFSLHLWSCPFYSILKFSAILTFLKYKYNHITPQMHILRWFPSVFYIKSDVLVGHLRPFTFGLCLFSVHFLPLNHDGRHFALLLTKL